MDTINTELPDDYLIGLLVVIVFSLLSYGSKKIDGLGALIGGLIAWCIFLGGNFPAMGLLFAFFVLGSAASSWKMKRKEELGLAEKNKGKRTVINAVSNGGVAALCGTLAFLFPEYQQHFIAMLAASLASATSDTLSSELGNVYGTQYVNILSFKTDQRGKDGVISWEGTVIGLLGSLMLGICYGLGFGFELSFVIVVIVGFLGNILDSILGATLQQQKRLSNHGVNLMNTLLAAVIAGIVLAMI